MNDPELLKEIISNQDVLRVLKHMQLAKVDYAKNITKYTEIRMDVVNNCLKYLKEIDAVTIYRNTSVKRTAAKLKKSSEVHKHHTYYSITKTGTGLLNEITPKLYLETMDISALNIFFRKKIVPEDYVLREELIKFGIIDKKGKITPTGDEIFKEGLRIGVLKR